MRRRGKPRTGGDGLWKWTPSGVERAEITNNPLRRPCLLEDGGCGAAVAQPCTRPGRGGRVPISTYHEARTNPEPEETSTDAAQHQL